MPFPRRLTMTFASRSLTRAGGRKLQNHELPPMDRFARDASGKETILTPAMPVSTRILCVGVGLVVAFGIRTRAATVLTLVEERLYNATRAEIAAWSRQVESEGTFKVELRKRPRVSPTSARRYSQVQQNRILIADLGPEAVQIFGAVAIGASGWQAADGHEMRCVYTDAPYMIDWDTPLTDTRDFGVNRSQPAWSNVAGDGRWDQNLVVSFRRPAARVNFADLPMAGPSLRIPQGCLKGKPVCPAVDEVVAFKDYLRRDLDFRQGRWKPPRVACLQGALWDLGDGAPRRFIKAQIGGMPWQETEDPSGVAGRDVFLLFHNLDRDHLYEFVDPDCHWVRAVWANSYRSFTMEQYVSCGVIRRWLQHALVSTWGPMWWVIPPSARTVADAITATARNHGHWNMLYTVAGDVTLPLHPPAGEGPESTARGGGG